MIFTHMLLFLTIYVYFIREKSRENIWEPKAFKKLDKAQLLPQKTALKLEIFFIYIYVCRHTRNDQ